jgi:hypothetical protein
MLDLDLCLSAVCCGVMTTMTSSLVASLLVGGVILSQSLQPWVIFALSVLPFIQLSFSLQQILWIQNLFTQLSDIAVMFWLYLQLQNSKRHETSWVSSQISYMIFYQKFSTIQYIFWEMWTKHWSYQNLETQLTQSTCLFCIWSSRSPIELIPVGLVS